MERKTRIVRVEREKGIVRSGEEDEDSKSREGGK